MADDPLNRGRDTLLLIGRKLGKRPKDLQRAFAIAETIDALEREERELTSRRKAVGVELVRNRQELSVLLGLEDAEAPDPRASPEGHEDRPAKPIDLDALIAKTAPARATLPSDEPVRLGRRQWEVLNLVPRTGKVSLNELATCIYGEDSVTTQDAARQLVRKLVSKGLVTHPAGVTDYSRTERGRAVAGQESVRGDGRAPGNGGAMK